MKSIQSARQTLVAYPFLAGLAVLAVTFASLPIGVALLSAAFLALAWPTIERHRSPEDRAEMAVESMRRQTLRVVQEVSAVVADEKLLAQEVERERFQARRWEERAVKAMLTGNEAEAASCIERKQEHDAKVALMTPELERQRAAVQGLKPSVERMRVQAAEAKRDGELLAVRARRAAAKRTVVLTASGLETRAGEQAFQRFADDVAREEAKAEALEELLGSDAGDEQAKAWERSERSEAVASEVEALRVRVNGRALGGKAAG